MTLTTFSASPLQLRVDLERAARAPRDAGGHVGRPVHGNRALDALLGVPHRLLKAAPEDAQVRERHRRPARIARLDAPVVERKRPSGERPARVADAEDEVALHEVVPLAARRGPVAPAPRRREGRRLRARVAGRQDHVGGRVRDEFRNRIRVDGRPRSPRADHPQPTPHPLQALSVHALLLVFYPANLSIH